MSNILGASDEEDEKIRLRDGELSSSGPPQLVKRKSKRKLTKLESDESDQEDDESEEFKLSEYVSLQVRDLKGNRHTTLLLRGKKDITKLLSIQHLNILLCKLRQY